METQEHFNILIIDHNKDFNDNLHNEFQNFNCKTIQAFNINKGLELIKMYDEKLDLIVLNISDTQVNTISTLSQINKNNNKTKVVLLSEKEETNEREQYFKYGILDYFLKSDSIKYIANDIFNALIRLKENQLETILIIDDSRLTSNMVKYLLENRNYNTLTALNAKDGIKLISKHSISLLILDMELPDMHGIKLLEVLRDMYELENFPVLVLSASNNPAIIRQALKKGGSDFLRKPFLYEEFLLKIDLWIKSSRRQKTIKKQKKQIENSLKQFGELFNSTMEALLLFKEDVCIDVNQEAVKLFGENEKNDLIGSKILEIFNQFSPEHTSELVDDTSDHFFEDNILNKQNDLLQIQIKETNILIDSERLKIIAVMDITSIKQQEKMLSHQTKMASMGEMIGNIAHQWRQPLTAISVAAGGIKLNYELDMVDQDEILVELDNIVSNTQFLSTTIEDFQNFLKDDRATTIFTIKQAIDKTLAIIKANLESHEINVIQNVSENIQINAIQNDLIQVLLNFVNNAADILKTPEYKEKEKYIIINVTNDSSYLTISVQDNAGGIPENIIGKIFEPYFTTKHQAKGTGLGLYMTHQIVVDNMRGSINVENLEFIYNDKIFFGANFTIKIPIN